ncbi:hypothetical protein N656DRAFT_554735 [Canariomyces notabilis]|uniref:Uncharacterized protein n=1 Tax=Canariomyces notabilis TaxID=2074819 RepID=A0AAN6TI97_9PEZI|nr:hypothetical protein N656DRAFT_554735 [Canariomyces arenarius]
MSCFVVTRWKDGGSGSLNICLDAACPHDRALKHSSAASARLVSLRWRSRQSDVGAGGCLSQRRSQLSPLGSVTRRVSADMHPDFPWNSLKGDRSSPEPLIKTTHIKDILGTILSSIPARDAHLVAMCVWSLEHSSNMAQWCSNCLAHSHTRPQVGGQP